MKFLLTTIITFILYHYSFGEILQNDTYVSNKIDGEQYLIINKGTEIRLINSNNDWCNIWIRAVIKKIEFMGDSAVIFKGTKLYDKRNGSVIGELIQDFYIYEPFGVSEKINGYYDYSFGGYINLLNIDPASIPERVLERLINNILPKKVFIKDVLEYTKSFGFREIDFICGDTFASYGGYDLLDGYYLHPGIRIELIFKDSLLIGIFHIHKLNIRNNNSCKITFQFLNDCCYLYTMDYINEATRNHLCEKYKEFLYSID